MLYRGDNAISHSTYLTNSPYWKKSGEGGWCTQWAQTWQHSTYWLLHSTSFTKLLAFFSFYFIFIIIQLEPTTSLAPTFTPPPPRTTRETDSWPITKNLHRRFEWCNKIDWEKSKQNKSEIIREKHATIDNDGEYTPVNTREKYRVSFSN